MRHSGPCWPSGKEGLLTFPPYAGSLTDRSAAARWLTSTVRAVAPQDVFLCSGGNHALVALLGAKLKGHRIAAEAFTYPAFKAIVGQLGADVVACDMDEEGLDPAALEVAVRERRVDAVYLQPTIQNPSCSVTSLARRQEIVALARTHDLLIVEDDAYRFLASDAPPRMADLAPERTLAIISLSKLINPLLKTAYLIAPVSLAEDIEAAIRLTASGASSLLAAAASRLVENLALSHRSRPSASKREGAKHCFVPYGTAWRTALIQRRSTCGWSYRPAARVLQ